MKRILIVEDDTRIATALGVRLEAAGYAVLIAPDGFRGLRLALAWRPDLIVMDIWMPVGIGFSVAQRLKGLGVTDTPIIFITASKLEGLRETVLQLGAAAFFEKPYNARELLQTIAQELRKKDEASPVQPEATALST
jgi:DNA-binding response OmpR family regulator